MRTKFLFPYKNFENFHLQDSAAYMDLTIDWIEQISGKEYVDLTNIKFWRVDKQEKLLEVLKWKFRWTTA